MTDLQKKLDEAIVKKSKKLVSQSLKISFFIDIVPKLIVFLMLSSTHAHEESMKKLLDKARAHQAFVCQFTCERDIFFLFERE